MIRGTSCGRGCRGLVAPLVIAAALAVPSTALAHDTYVDRSDGSDSNNNCRHRANPCEGIGYALNHTGNGDTAFVGGDPIAFTSTTDLNDGKSIVHKDFSTKPSIDTSGKTIIDTGSSPDPAIDVTGKAGAIKRLTIRSEYLPLEIQAKVTATQLTFDEPDAITNIEEVEISGGSPKITDSTFFDPSPSGGAEQRGIVSNSGGSPVISHNSFGSFSQSVRVNDGSPTIKKNGIQGTHSAVNPGRGVYVGPAGSATITGNRFSNPNNTSAVRAVDVLGRATISRNEILDYNVGVNLDDTPKPVKLDNDAITTIEFGSGIHAADSGADDPKVSDLHLTNVTVTGEGTQISLEQTHMRMDSSLVLATGAGSDMSLGTPVKCNITYSRGDNTSPANDGCTFNTKKNPDLKSDGYHLKSSSPMIDKGKPHDPPSGTKDVDGDKRALDGPDGGNCNGAPRRDIGADEFDC